LNNMQTWTMVFREVDKDRFEEMIGEKEARAIRRQVKKHPN